MITFSSSLLKARPYRYYLLLHDFINRKKFTVAHSEHGVAFDYMGNATKFYTPDSFRTYHDVYEAITWMKTASIYFKAGDAVYTLPQIAMPDDYEHGSTSEFYHIYTGVAVLAYLMTGNHRKEEIEKNLSLIAERKVSVDRDHTIELDVNVNPSTMGIISDPMFRPLLKTELIYAYNFIRQRIVTGNLDYFIALPKYKIKLVIGKNRGIAVDDVKLYESVNGNFKEVKLEHRTKRR